MVVADARSLHGCFQLLSTEVEVCRNDSYCSHFLPFPLPSPVITIFEILGGREMCIVSSVRSCVQSTNYWVQRSTDSFRVIWKHFCFILFISTRIRIDYVMRPRSSSRGRSKSALVTVTVAATIGVARILSAGVHFFAKKVDDLF